MEYKLTPGGGGSLKFHEESGKVIFDAVRPDDKLGLYKLRICGRGNCLELGTFLPEKGVLHLRRTLLMEKLVSEGCWPVTGAEVLLAVPFVSDRLPGGWVREESPARLLHGDRLLERSASDFQEALIFREPGFFRLAFPFREDSAFALVPLFCLATVEQLGGRPYSVFRFREDGVPVIPQR